MKKITIVILGILMLFSAGCIPAPKVATGDSRVDQAKTNLQALNIIENGQPSTTLWANTENLDNCNEQGAKVAYVVGPNEAVQTVYTMNEAAYFMAFVRASCLNQGASEVFFVKFNGTDLTYYGGASANVRWNEFWNLMSGTYALPVKQWNASPYLLDGVHLNANGNTAFATWLNSELE